MGRVVAEGLRDQTGYFHCGCERNSVINMMCCLRYINRPQMAAIRVATPEAVSLQLTSTPLITHIVEESEID